MIKLYLCFNFLRTREDSNLRPSAWNAIIVLWSLLQTTLFSMLYQLSYLSENKKIKKRTGKDSHLRPTD